MSDAWQESTSWFPQSFEALREAGAEISIVSFNEAYRPPWVQEHYPILSRWISLPLSQMDPSFAENRAIRIASNLSRNPIRKISRLMERIVNRIVQGYHRSKIRKEYFPEAPPFADRRYDHFESIYRGIIASQADIIWVLKGHYLDIATLAAKKVDAQIVYEHVDLCYTGSDANECLAKWMPYEVALAKKTASTIVCAPGYVTYYQSYASDAPIPRIYARYLTPNFMAASLIQPQKPLRYLHFGRSHPSRLPGLLIRAFEKTDADALLTFQGPNNMCSDTQLDRDIFEKAAAGNYPKVQVLESCSVDQIFDTVRSHDVGIVLHDTLAEGRIHCLTTKICTYFAAGLMVLSVDTPGIRAGVKDSEAVIFLRDSSVKSIAEALDCIDSMSDEEVMRRKNAALEMAQLWDWESHGKAEYIAEFVHAANQSFRR